MVKPGVNSYLLCPLSMYILVESAHVLKTDGSEETAFLF